MKKVGMRTIMYANVCFSSFLLLRGTGMKEKVECCERENNEENAWNGRTKILTLLCRSFSMVDYYC